jgi:hypothetical protein
MMMVIFKHEDVAEVTECLLGKHRTLSSNSSATKKINKKKNNFENV